MRRRILAAASVSAVALLLSACSNDSSQSGGKAAEEYQPGPLEKYMSAMWSGQEWSIEQAKADDLKREEMIAECMAKEGFEYIPNTSSVTYGTDENSDGPQWGTLEFAEQYGYGMVDFPGSQVEAEMVEEHVDPNQEYIESLSESEQTAFYETLYGKGPSEEDLKLMESGEIEWESDWTKEGCNGWAYHEMNSDSAMGFWQDPEFEDLVAAMNDIGTQMEADPEYAAMNAEWTACMADAGFTLSGGKNYAMNEINDKYNAMMTDSSGNYVEPTKEQYDEFQKLEISQATADFKCAEKVEYDKRTTEIQHRLEQQLLDQYKTQLDSALAKYAASSKDS